MKSNDRSHEKRGSFRCPVTDAQQEAELKVGRRRLPVLLSNESSGGFAAWGDRDPGVKIDDTVMLATAGGHFEVRVAHLTKFEPSEDSNEEMAPVYRVGLQRLKELKTSGGNQPPSLGVLSRIRQHPLVPSGTSVVILTTLLLVALLMGALAVLSNLDSPIVRRFNHWDQHWQGPASDAKPSLKDIFRDAGLADPQQRRLQGIAETTAEAFQELDTLWINDTPEERARKQALFLEAARREVEKLLTPEQRVRWNALFRSLPS